MMRELFGFRLNEIPLDSVTIILTSVPAMVSGQGQHRQRLNPIGRPEYRKALGSGQTLPYDRKAEDTMTRHFIRSAGPYVKHIPTTRLECSTSPHLYKVARLDCTAFKFGSVIVRRLFRAGLASRQSRAATFFLSS